MTRATRPVRATLRSAGNLFLTQAKKSLPAGLLAGPWPPRRLIATHANSKFPLNHSKHMLVTISNSNTIPVSANCLPRPTPRAPHPSPLLQSFGYTIRMPVANQTSFRRAAVIGTGLIGGSFALALGRHFPAIARVGFDRKDTLERAIVRGAIQESAGDLSAAVRDADLVYIALPIAAAIESLPAIAASARPDALVTDACSTKTVICRSAKDHFRSGARFLGGHPIAGKETSGAEHSNADLFRGSRYALIAQEEDPDPRVQQFAALLRTLGAEPDWCDAETHDWAVGIVSHLPQLLSVALARVVQDESDETGLPVTLAGRGLQDMLRLAGSPYNVWRDICLTNSENISRALDRLTQAVDYLRTHLSSKDLEQEFRAANELYKFLHKSDR